jgi:acyl-CoA reductase-like NAD-dependent aldehyde dehydrogenase
MLAVTESWENGKSVRETLAADIPLAADHFRYFAAAIRTEALAANPRIAKVAFTRRDCHRQADHAVRGAEPHPSHAGTRRQVTEHLLPRRDGRQRRLPRQGRRGPGAVRVQ